MVFSLLGCTPSALDEYDNFYNDIDLKNRFTEYLSSVKQGDTSPFLRSAIITLIDDLKDYSVYYQYQNDQTNMINQMYIDSASYLLSSLDYLKENDTLSYNAYLKSSEKLFLKTTALLEQSIYENTLS